MHRAVRRIALFGLLAAATPAPAQASCASAPLVSMPLRTEGGRILVEVAINEQPAWFAVDTGASGSVISTKLAQRLGLSTGRFRTLGATDISGNRAEMLTSRVRMTLGGQSSSRFRRYVVADLNVDGLLGTDLLGGFDVDLDFAGAQISLFSRSVCRGTPPGAGPFSSVSMAVIGANDRIRAPVTLNGKDYWAVIDTGANRSYMAASNAQADFGIRVDESKTGRARSAYGGELRVTPHDFASLKIGDVLLTNPRLFLTTPENGFEESPVLLGLEHLRELRLFVAYSSRRLYIARARQP